MPDRIIYATSWQRLTAFMLDLFIVALPVFTLVLTIITPLFFDAKAIQAASNKEFELIYQLYKNGVFISLIGFSAVCLILAVFTTSRWQATPGKRLVSIYIAGKNGSRVSFADAFGRFFSLPLFILMLQIFERRMNYAVLDQMRKSGQGTSDINAIESHLSGPAAQITSIAILLTLAIWFAKIFFSADRTALHDTLFNTHVLQGKKPLHLHV